MGQTAAIGIQVALHEQKLTASQCDRRGQHIGYSTSSLPDVERNVSQLDGTFPQGECGRRHRRGAVGQHAELVKRHGSREWQHVHPDDLAGQHGWLQLVQQVVGCAHCHRNLQRWGCGIHGSVSVRQRQHDASSAVQRCCGQCHAVSVTDRDYACG